MKTIVGSTDAAWQQSRFVVSLALTVCIVAMAGAVYVLLKHRERLAAVLFSGGRLEKLLRLYGFALGGAAIVVFILSLFPRSSLGLGIILYMFLWPALAMQFGASLLSWRRYAQKQSSAVLLAFIIGFFAYCIDHMVLQLAGYIR